MIAPEAGLSVTRQCALLGIASSSFYYRPRPNSAEEVDVHARHCPKCQGTVSSHLPASPPNCWSMRSASSDAAIILAAPGAAPVGLGSTGNPVFNVPASMLGIPALSLPLLSIDGLPLGLQIAGFVGEDASLFAVAAAIRDLLGTAA